MKFIYLQKATSVGVLTTKDFQSMRVFKTFLNTFLIIEENIALKTDKLHTFRSVWDTIWPYQE